MKDPILVCFLALSLTACAVPQKQAQLVTYAEEPVVAAPVIEVAPEPVEQVAVNMTPLPVSNCQRSFDAIMASAAERLHDLHRM
ncbi:MAG TPA: hypothetical protein VGF14_03515 [Alphaproteobacteria bacterium]